MSWQIGFRPEVERDVAQAAAWYEKRQPVLGPDFIEEVIRMWDSLEDDPLLGNRRLPTKNIRWRMMERFPYQVNGA